MPLLGSKLNLLWRRHSPGTETQEGPRVSPRGALGLGPACPLPHPPTGHPRAVSGGVGWNLPTDCRDLSHLEKGNLQSG